MQKIVAKKMAVCKNGFYYYGNHKKVRNVGIIVGEGGGCTLLLVGL